MGWIERTTFSPPENLGHRTSGLRAPGAVATEVAGESGAKVG